ncbi:DNA polymerase [Thermocladium modestius]|uniref:DNA polymerase n=1 Tax=Thermocladium modestius TaxID=62609 RepID=A0A830GV83_9CREN|nr:nucleotidyltransferase domain-containing protein [Thermocladium modestius]GGP20332.1 DNA polymerase [Thermocladium modestius]
MIEEPYGSLLNKLLNLLVNRFRDELYSVVVYGSVARGDNRKDSDIDLLIIAEGLPKSMIGRYRIFEQVELQLMGDVEKLYDEGYYVSFSPIMKTPEEASHFSPLYMDMVEDAVILFDKDNFFGNILKRVKEKLNELGFERVWLGRKWYWRKRDYRFGEIIDFGD